MSEAVSELFAESEIEPEPIGLNRYAIKALEASWGLGRSGRLTDWISDTDDSRFTLRPKKIVGVMGGRAFDNYAAFSEDDRHQLAYEASLVMNKIGGDAMSGDAYTMINYVPLLFTSSGLAIVGFRERYAQKITFESDKLLGAHQRHMLVGGLATVMYYSDYPHELDNVE